MTFEEHIESIVRAVLATDSLHDFVIAPDEHSFDVLVKSVVKELTGIGQCVHGIIEPAYCDTCKHLVPTHTGDNGSTR